MYLEQQGIVNINWDKLNVAYHGVLSTVTVLPVTTNLGIPLTGSMATGFAIGFMKG
jgi:uncharacterized membrane protein (Fun14 family)